MVLETVMIYCSAFILTIACSFISQKKNRFIYVFIAILFIVFISSFRDYSVGIDTLQYSRVFASINGTLDTTQYVYVPSIEKTFQFFIQALLFISKGSFHFVFGVIAFIIHFFCIRRLWELRSKISFTFSVFLFLIVFFFLSLNIMRQLCAVSLVFWATRFIGKKRYLFFSFFVLLAACFHISAVLAFIYLGLELFRWRELNTRQKNFIFVLLLFAFFIVPFAFTVLFNRYSHYIVGTASVNIGWLLVLKIVYFIVLLHLLKKPINNDNVSDETYLSKSQIVFYVITGIMLTSLGYVFTFVQRIGLFFSIFEIIALSAFFKGNRNNRLLIVAGVCVLWLAPFIIECINNGNGQFPYVFNFS